MDEIRKIRMKRIEKIVCECLTLVATGIAPDIHGRTRMRCSDCGKLHLMERPHELEVGQPISRGYYRPEYVKTLGKWRKWER